MSQVTQNSKLRFKCFVIKLYSAASKTVDTEMKQVLHILTRVSTTIQEEEGYGLESQLAEGIAVAEMLGFDYQHWDEGAVSSSTSDLSKRPVMTQLMLAVQDGTVEHLYVFGYDRLWRSDAVWSEYKVFLIRGGVKIYTGRNPAPADLTNPQDKLMLNVLSSFAIFDNELRQERFRLGKLQSVKTGNWKGGPPPYGFTIKNSKLEIDPYEAKQVKTIFEKYRDGASYTDIKKYLMSNGVVTRRKNVTWTDGSLAKILTSTYHDGRWVFTDGKTGESVTCVCERTVSKRLFLEVQNEIKKRSYKQHASRRTRQPNQKQVTLLSDVLFCGECGSRWNVQNRKNAIYSNYFCSNKPSLTSRAQNQRKKPSCTVDRSLNLQVTNQFVWDAVIETLSNSSIYKETIKVATLGDKSVSASKAEIKKLKLKKKKIDNQIMHITDSIIDLEIKKRTEDRNEEEVNLIIKGMDDARRTMQLESQNLTDQIENGGKSVEWIDWINKFESKMDDLKSDGWNTETKKDFLDGIVDRVTVELLDKQRVNLLISFKLPFVNDKIEYNNLNRKSDGYEIIDGKNNLQLEVDLNGKKLLQTNAL